MGTTDLQLTTANADDYSPNELIIRIRLLEPDAARSYIAAQLLDELWSSYVEMATIDGGRSDDAISTVHVR